MKRKDELKEYKELNKEMLQEKIEFLKEDLMKLRFRHASGQLENTGRMKEVRHSIARASTLMSEMEKTQGGQPSA